MKKRHGRWPRRLLPSIIVLCLVAVVFLLAYVRFPDVRWIGAFAPNITTTALGILAVIVLVDRIVERTREEDRRKRVRLAAERLHLPLVRHYGTLMDMFKAAAAHPAVLTRAGEDPIAWLDDGFVKELPLLDFHGSAPVTPPMDWFDYLSQEAKRFREALLRVADSSCGVVLEAEDLTLLQELANDSFLSLLEQIPAAKRGGQRIMVLLEAEALIREHAELLTRLIRLCKDLNPDKPLPAPRSLSRKDVAPQVGSSRLPRRSWGAR